MNLVPAKVVLGRRIAREHGPEFRHAVDGDRPRPDFICHPVVDALLIILIDPERLRFSGARGDAEGEFSIKANILAGAARDGTRAI